MRNERRINFLWSNVMKCRLTKKTFLLFLTYPYAISFLKFKPFFSTTFLIHYLVVKYRKCALE